MDAIPDASPDVTTYGDGNVTIATGRSPGTYYYAVLPIRVPLVVHHQLHHGLRHATCER